MINKLEISEWGQSLRGMAMRKEKKLLNWVRSIARSFGVWCVGKSKRNFNAELETSDGFISHTEC